MIIVASDCHLRVFWENESRLRRYSAAMAACSQPRASSIIFAISGRHLPHWGRVPHRRNTSPTDFASSAFARIWRSRSALQMQTYMEPANNRPPRGLTLFGATTANANDCQERALFDRSFKPVNLLHKIVLGKNRAKVALYCDPKGLALYERSVESDERRRTCPKGSCGVRAQEKFARGQPPENSPCGGYFCGRLITSPRAVFATRVANEIDGKRLGSAGLA